MPGWLLLIPFFLVRFGLMAACSRTAIRRAAHFAPLMGGERIAYWVYQLSNLGILICLFFLNIQTVPPGWFYAGLGVCTVGTTLLAAAVVGFAAPAKNGFNRNGVYRLSRNPMYVAYFIYFIGCALLTQSLVLLGIVLVFQFAAHWIILSEERWCTEQFGDEYRQYMGRVRRYV